ncbi:MAG: hypothetical protein ACJ75N_20705, partial [Actinomycetes bacterium]
PLTAQVLLDGALFAVGFPLGYATVGLILTLRRPANPIGWLYAASALTWSLIIPLGPWIDQLVRDQRPLPLIAKLDAMAAVTIWAPAIALGVTLPALLVPNGRLRSRRWRVVAAAAVAGPVMFVAGVVLIPGPTSDTPVPFDNPFGQPGLVGSVAKAVAAAGLALHVVSLLAALACVILRFRASRGTERQQLRWVAAGAAGAVAGLLLALPGGLGITSGWISNIVYPAMLCPPVAVGVAVLRYRLYDLDRVISRTLTYGLLTVLLGLGYTAVVLGLGRLLPEGSGLAVAAATLAAAAAFSPLRRRVQDLVDRRFNRRRYDAAGTVAAFAARLRDQVDLDALHTELLAVVDQTVQPTRASLWLRGAPR